jgi:hypothetical protein
MVSSSLTALLIIILLKRGAQYCNPNSLTGRKTSDGRYGVHGNGLPRQCKQQTVFLAMGFSLEGLNKTLPCRKKESDLRGLPIAHQIGLFFLFASIVF